MDITRLFDSIAERYDLANHLTSLGTHLLWKRIFVKEIKAAFGGKPSRILDIACGSGDVADLLLKSFGKGTPVVGLDPSGSMLRCARRRFQKREVSLVRGKAESLPFKGESFDVVSTSFGIRNFSDRHSAVREIRRVLKRGGIFAVLEFSKPEDGLLGKLSWWYTEKVVPILGGLLTGNGEAYRYLASSIADFPSPEGLSKEIEREGFEKLKVRRLFPPVAVLYLFRAV